jgi:hypothetical protein
MGKKDGTNNSRRMQIWAKSSFKDTAKFQDPRPPRPHVLIIFGLNSVFIVLMETN